MRNSFYYCTFAPRIDKRINISLLIFNLKTFMTKYLMTGVAALALCAGFTSCSSDEIETLSQDQILHANFKNNFVQTFGKVDSKQDWGFTNMNAVRTRGAYVNHNEWGQGYNQGSEGFLATPKEVTAKERELVYNAFNKEIKTARTVNIKWTDFCISQVWKGTESYYDWAQYNWTNGAEPVRGELKADAQKTIFASDEMSYLQVLKGEGSIKDGELVGAWEHANDFNNGDNQSGYQTVQGHTYMLNSGTLDFAYHNVIDSKYHNEYYIIPGSEIDESLADFYYVGFDFSANAMYVDEDGVPQHLNMCADRDYYYTDWIVRISPAEFMPYIPDSDAKRVVAEDLAGGKSDFDYNDVVFDVNPAYIANPAENNYQPALYARIIVLAAGGTMPLYIGGKENGQEVHELFGVDTKTMVNTNNGTVSKRPVSFILKLRDCADWNDNAYNINDIPVVVVTPEGDITLQAVKGQPAEKVLVGTDYEWCDERESINDKYFGPQDMHFPAYAQGRKYQWNTWYKEDAE